MLAADGAEWVPIVHAAAREPMEWKRSKKKA